MARNRNDELSILEITKRSYSKISIWSELYTRFRALLISKVEKIFINIKKYGLEEYITYDPKSKKVKVDIFDKTGKISQQKLKALSDRISSPTAVHGAGQTTLV